MNTLHAIFNWLLVVSLRASALTLLVFVVQWVLQRYLSPRWRYALWLPVLIVLLAPVLPESRWSIESVFQTEPQPVEMHSVPVIADIASASLPSITHPVVSMPAPVDWRNIQLMTWALGTSLLLLVGGFSFLRTLLRFRQSRQGVSDDLLSQLDAISREVGLRHSPQVLVAPAIQSPAVTGLLRPTLLLPAGFERDFTVEEARLILQHELTHLKRHDLPLNALLCVLMALHWFNPLLWLAFFKARADREAACDAQVLANATPQRRSEYGHALLKVEAAFAPLRLSLGFIGMLQRGATLRARIRSIALPSRTRPLAGLLATCCITGMTFLGITRAEKPSAPASMNTSPELIGLEIKVITFNQSSNWDLNGRLGPPPAKANEPPKELVLQMQTLSAQDLGKLLEETSKQPGANVVAYPRIVTQDGKKVSVRSVVNQPVPSGQIDKDGNQRIRQLPIGFVGHFTAKHLPGDKIFLDLDITDSKIIGEQKISGQPYPVTRSSVYRAPVELSLGMSTAVYGWEEPFLKDGKLTKARPVLYVITPSLIDGVSIGNSAFRSGDSIRITSMSRTDDMLTVDLDYELDSTDEATAALYITSATEKSPAFDKRQEAVVKKGRGSLTLQHPKPYAGLPHVTFYDAKTRKPIGGIYFGTQEEADASRKLDLSYMASTTSATDANAFLANKLTRIILPRVVFKEASLEEAIEFLRVKSRALDTTTTDKKQKGVPILVRQGDKSYGFVSIDLTDVPLKEALEYITKLAGCQYRLTPYAVVVEQAPADKPCFPSELKNSAEMTGPLPKGGDLVLPQVEFRDATLNDALDFIRLKARDLDPAKKGVNIVVKPHAADLKTRITLSLKDIPVSEALRYIAELSNHHLTADAQSFYLSSIEKEPVNTTKQEAASGAKQLPDSALTQADKLRHAPPKSYDFSKAVMGDVLRYLATDAGLHFVSLPNDDPFSSRLITFSIHAAPFQVLETICKANGLTLLLEQDVWHVRTAEGSELVSRSYTVPATRIPAKTLCEDLSALANLPIRDLKDNNDKPVASITASDDTLHVTATRQQHIWVSGYLEAVRNLSSQKKTEIIK